MTLSNILLASKMNYHPTSYAVSEVMSNPSSMSSMSKVGGIRFGFLPWPEWRSIPGAMNRAPTPHLLLYVLCALLFSLESLNPYPSLFIFLDIRPGFCN